MQRIYRGKYTYLVPLQKCHTQLIIQWRNKDFVRDMFINQDVLTEEVHEEWLENMINTHKAEQFIIYTKRENKAIGTIFLKNIDKIKGTAEYGNFIGEENFLGKGYGTDAGKTLVQFAFKELGLSYIYLRVLEKNKRAIKAYQKIGFTYIDVSYMSEGREDVIFMKLEREMGNRMK